MKKIIGVIENLIYRFASQFPLFILLMLYALAPVFFDSWGIGFPTFIRRVFFQPVLPAIILCLLSSYSKWFGWVVVIASSCLFTGELFCIFAQGQRINSAVMVLVFQSNLRETEEFIYASGIQAIEALTMELIIISLYIVCKRLWTNRIFNNLVNILQRSQRTITILILLAVGSSLMSVETNKYAITELYNSYWKRLECMNHASATVAYYYGFADALFNPALEQLDHLENTLDSIHVADNTASANDSLTVVYVIGESFNRHRSNLYGYPLNTNPNLSRHHKNGNLIAFLNVVTPFNFTIDLIGPLLSLHDVESQEEFGKFPLFPAIFKKAGYKVAYFDNQSVVASRNLDFGCTYFFSRKAIVDACTDSVNTVNYTYDGDLIRKNMPDISDGKSLIIYHLMGQHQRYSLRYPEGYSYFTTDDYKSIYPYTDNEITMVIHYDNATRYNDAVIQSIIDCLENRDALLVYTPDHGDECHDFRTHVGREFNPTQLGSIRAVFEVPAIIWMSDKFMAARPALVDSLRQNINKPIYNVDLPHTLLDIAGLSTTDLQTRLSLLHKDGGRHNRVLFKKFYYDRRRDEVDSVRLRYM